MKKERCDQSTAEKIRIGILKRVSKKFIDVTEVKYFLECLGKS